ncbi:hypothetical protein Tco_0996943 [Tanacetum coccineum]
MPWLDYGPWMEPSDDTEHICKLFRFKNGHAKITIGKRKNIAMKGVDEEPSDNARTHYSASDEWEDFERADHLGADANSNYKPYLNVSRIFNHGAGTNNEQFDEHKLMGDDDYDISDLEDYLIQKDPPCYLNEEEERSKERRCKLLGILYVKPPTCKSEKFKVVKSSFGPTKEYVTIKEYEYDIWV